MDNKFGLSILDIQKNQAINELAKCNDLTAEYGLYLSNRQIECLVEGRFDALKNNGRIEFGQGIMKKLIETFCDSVYICQQNYVATLLELQELFYYFKNESADELSDDELIGYMKNYFEEECQGSLEYLGGTSLDKLCRDLRCGCEADYSFKRRYER